MCFRLFNLFNYESGVHRFFSGHGLFHVDLALETYAAEDIVANLAKGFPNSSVLVPIGWEFSLQMAGNGQNTAFIIVK